MDLVSLEISVPLYGLEALYKACYRFLERAYIRLEGDPAGTVTVLLRPKPEVKDFFPESLKGELENELLHQALRARVSSSSRRIREHIVTCALAGAEGAGKNPLKKSGSCPRTKADAPSL